MATKPAAEVKEEPVLTEDGRVANIAAEPATTFDERTKTQTPLEQVAEPEQ